MLISPPFLPLRMPGQSDADWVDMAMQQPAGRAPLSSAREGSFPLSAALMWHNGIHVQARRGSDGAWPAVRAVASGTIVYVGAPSKRNDDIADPQNYNPFGTGAAWTDNGMVIVEHEAEIGASNDATGAPTTFRFHSACMHLSSVATNPATRSAWAPGDAVARKDELGQPGSIYGASGQLHFEICCDAASAAVILGRPAGWKENRPAEAPTSDGRTDSVFGSLWFYLPAGTPTRTTAPTQHRRATSGAGASAATDHFLPETLRQPCWVELRYAHGDATLTSRDADGRPVGMPLSAKQAEYDLYKEATRRHESYSKQNPAPSGLVESSPSGWYELLRFGRNLGFGSGADPLPSEAAHWREIPTATGKIWADLNARGTFKFSDADFLPVAGWNCYDDDVNVDNQLCESSHLRRMLRSREQRDRMASMPQRNAQTNIEDRMSIAQRLNEPSLQIIQRRAVCSFPSEWDRGSIEKRYEWVRDPMEKLGMEDELNWKHLAAHLTVVSFDDLPRSYKSSIWRFHPAEFISIFRQCEWLSKENLNDIYPDSLYNRKLTPDPSQLREKFRPHLNRAMRKYCINTTTRQAHFFGQGAIESAFLSLMIESSVNPSKNPEHASLKSEADGYYTSASDQYFNKYDYRLGNVDIGDGIKFRGRGMKQLTALENYSKYWVHRGWISRDSFSRKWWVDKAARTIGYKDLSQKSPVINDPQRLSIDEWNCIDAGAWYWEAGAVRTGFNSINTSIKENGVAASDILVVTLAINGGTNGLTEREKQTQRISKVLMDQER